MPVRLAFGFFHLADACDVQSGTHPSSQYTRSDQFVLIARCIKCNEQIRPSLRNRVASYWLLSVGNEAAMDNEVPMIQCLTHLSTTISMYTHCGIDRKSTRLNSSHLG